MNEINFVEVDAQKISNEMIEAFEAAYGETFYPGDERRIFLEQLLQVIVGVKTSINDSARQNLLRYARGEILDALGGLTERIPAQKAKTRLRFTLSGAQADDYLIPEGTRVTPDGKIYFATSAALTIPAGVLAGDIAAESSEGGANYNGFAPGQIKNLVDLIPYISSVANIDTSSGGADVEDDDHYRERIRLAPESYSVAGPEGAYIYWAKTADVNISDISVTSPSPGVVKIVVLMADGEIPSQTILDKVEAVTSAKDVRPLTDNVQVAAPTQVIYNIDFTYYIPLSRAAEEASIRSAIEGTGGAVDQYKAWQCSNLGKAINPDTLRLLVLQTGASRIVLASPAYTQLDSDEVAMVGTVTFTYGGME